MDVSDGITRAGPPPTNETRNRAVKGAIGAGGRKQREAAKRQVNGPEAVGTDCRSAGLPTRKGFPLPGPGRLSPVVVGGAQDTPGQASSVAWPLRRGPLPDNGVVRPLDPARWRPGRFTATRLTPLPLTSIQRHLSFGVAPKITSKTSSARRLSGRLREAGRTRFPDTGLTVTS